jgi:hypothetical protein
LPGYRLIDTALLYRREAVFVHAVHHDNKAGGKNTLKHLSLARTEKEIAAGIRMAGLKREQVP